jgi:hypothetical protein
MANLYVFHQGANTNGSLWYTWFNGATWSLDTPWGGGMPVQNLGMSGSPSAVVWRGGISVLHQGFADSGDLWYSYSPDGQHWGGDTPWGQPNFPVQGLGISGSPSAVVYNDLLYVFHQGANANGQLWYSYYDGTTWSQDKQIQGVGMSGSPSAVVWRGGISVFHQGGQGLNFSGDLWYTYSPDGQHWGGDTPWGQQNPPELGLGITGSPSAVVYNDLLYVFHQGANANGSLWYSQFNGDFWTPDTPIRYANMSASPSAVLWEGGISVFFQGGGDDGILWYVYSPDGAYQNFGAPTGWGYPFGPPITASLRMSQSPSCVVYGHRREP